MKDSGFRKVYNDKDNYDHHIKKNLDCSLFLNTYKNNRILLNQN